MSVPTPISDELTVFESGALTFAKAFVATWVGAILAFWFGLTPISTTSIWNAVSSDWNAAGGIAILAGLAAIGYHIPVAVAAKHKSKKV